MLQSYLLCCLLFVVLPSLAIPQPPPPPHISDLPDIPLFGPIRDGLLPPPFKLPNIPMIAEQLHNAGRECAQKHGTTFEVMERLFATGATDTSQDIKCAHKCVMQTPIDGEQMMQENGDFTMPQSIRFLAPGFQECADTVNNEDLCVKAWQLHITCHPNIKKFKELLRGSLPNLQI